MHQEKYWSGVLKKIDYNTRKKKKVKVYVDIVQEPLQIQKADIILMKKNY